MIYNQEVEFSMMANMHYSRFPINVASVNGIHALKTAVLLGPNNTGKTNFVRAASMMKSIMLNQAAGIVPSFFSGMDVVEASIFFLENGGEYIFEIGYDAAHGEYIYECFIEVQRDRHKNVKHNTLLLRCNWKFHKKHIENTKRLGTDPQCQVKFVYNRNLFFSL